MPTYRNDVTGSGEAAVVGASPNGRGIIGWSVLDYGVSGDSQKSAGIRGTSVEGRGTEGWSTNGEGVLGLSTNGTGVSGATDSAGTGVAGSSNTGYGVVGASKASAGVKGVSEKGRGVEGWSDDTEGVVGLSKTGNGVWGQTAGGTGVLGTSDSGVGIHGKGGRLAALFEGDIEVTGDIRLLNADCAEQFDVIDAGTAEPGTIMVLSPEGALQRSAHAYDKRVAGVVSGAGDYRPGIVLDRQPFTSTRRPIALLGKTFCKVDADLCPIEVGDLLTTSPTPGHAMKAADPQKAFGAVVGKALRSLPSGKGLIPMLIALQ